MPDSLLESKLVDHEYGAGAIKHRIGTLELPNGSTLFLNDVEAFSPAVQVNLLRVLEERDFIRIGSSWVIGIDVWSSP